MQRGLEEAEVRPVANLILNAEKAPLRSWGFPRGFQGADAGSARSPSP
ncbi:hypothetical protein [Moorena producens]